jgi:hypothetical protein
MSSPRNRGVLRQCIVSYLAVSALLTPTVFGIGGFLDLYVMNPPAGLVTPEPSYTTPITTNGAAAGWSFLTPEHTRARATIWASNGTPTNLNQGGPLDILDSSAFATSGNQTVGAVATTSFGTFSHAMLWNGPTNDMVDLNPQSFTSSNAYAIGGGQVVGSGASATTGGNNHALLWSLSTGTVTDLNPSGFTNSIAVATTGTVQIGYGQGPGRTGLLWSGTSQSAVPLDGSHLLGISSTQAFGGNANVQVGSGTSGSSIHAMMWRGTALSAVDLSPSFANRPNSEALGSNGLQEVGDAWGTQLVNGGPAYHAVLWSNSPNSAVDLQTFVPSYLVSSRAWTIDAAGNVLGTAQDASGAYHVVEWIVPEPSSLLFIGLTAALLGRRRLPRG